MLHLTREGAVKARTAARNQFTNLLVTAPETVKARLAGLTTGQQLNAAANFRARRHQRPERRDQDRAAGPGPTGHDPDR